MNKELKLHHAILAKNVDKVRCLLSQSADVNEKDSHERTPLHLTACTGNEEILKLLLETGKVDVNEKDGEGETPLQIAAFNGNQEVLKLLIDAGADVNVKDGNDNTILQYAIDCCCFDVAQTLIKAGADVNYKNSQGEAALHWAAGKNNVTLVRYLISHGADVNIKDSGQLTPLHYAVGCNSGRSTLNTVKVLLENGANVFSENYKGEMAVHCLVKKCKQIDSKLFKLFVSYMANYNLGFNHGEQQCRGVIDILRKIEEKIDVKEESRRSSSSDEKWMMIEREIKDLRELISSYEEKWDRLEGKVKEVQSLNEERLSKPGDKIASVDEEASERQDALERKISAIDEETSSIRKMSSASGKDDKYEPRILGSDRRGSSEQRLNSNEERQERIPSMQQERIPSVKEERIPSIQEERISIRRSSSVRRISSHVGSLNEHEVARVDLGRTSNESRWDTLEEKIKNIEQENEDMKKKVERLEEVVRKLMELKSAPDTEVQGGDS